MAEYKKEISVVGAIAVIAALGIGLFAINFFPNGSGTTTTTSQPVLGPAPLLGYLFTQGVSCSLSTGVCSMTILNNSTTPLQLASCEMQVILSGNSTSSTVHIVNGTVSGQATVGIPANSKASGTCTVSTSELTHQNASTFEGLKAGGLMRVRLVNSWYQFPAGTYASVGFEGSWS